MDNGTSNNPMAALYEALAKAQGEFPEIPKNRHVTIRMKSGGSFEFRYADLQEIISKTKPALSKYGLSVVQLLNTVQTASGAVNQLRTQLNHSLGGWLSSAIDLPAAPDGDPKTTGALITYYRRYTYSSMIGVSADDDLDERDTSHQPAVINADAVAEMTAVASQGTDAYKKYWVALTDEQRAERKAIHPGMKKIAAEADKKAVKTEARHVRQDEEKPVEKGEA